MRNSTLGVCILFLWATGAAFGASVEWALGRDLDLKMFLSLCAVLIFGMTLWAWRNEELKKEKVSLLVFIGACCIVYFVAMAGILSVTLIKWLYPIDSAGAVCTGAVTLMLIFGLLGVSWKSRDERDKQQAEENLHDSD